MLHVLPAYLPCPDENSAVVPTPYSAEGTVEPIAEVDGVRPSVSCIRISCSPRELESKREGRWSRIGG